MKTLKNVSIGDRFNTGKNTTAKVIDFYEVKSLTTGEIIGLCKIWAGIKYTGM